MRPRSRSRPGPAVSDSPCPPLAAAGLGLEFSLGPGLPRTGAPPENGNRTEGSALAPRLREYDEDGTSCGALAPGGSDPGAGAEVGTGLASLELLHKEAMMSFTK